MRQLSLTNKVPRGVSRRLRALERWSAQFKGWFPGGLDPQDRYCNWKIPVLRNLVEGRHSSKQIKAQCAQHLLNACQHLIAAKPSNLSGMRVTCVLCLPDMFSSEVCIYLDEAYFLSHTSPSRDAYGTTQRIVGRSLAQEWGLCMSPEMHELGLALDYRGFEHKDDWFVGERWYFGDVTEHG